MMTAGAPARRQGRSPEEIRRANVRLLVCMVIFAVALTAAVLLWMNSVRLRRDAYPAATGNSGETSLHWSSGALPSKHLA